MNHLKLRLRTHYNAYRDSAIQDTILPSRRFDGILNKKIGGIYSGFPEFVASIPTQDPARWPTVKDFLLEMTTNIETTIERGDETSYKKFLNYHQMGLIKVLKQMVAFEVEHKPEGVDAIDHLSRKSIEEMEEKAANSKHVHWTPWMKFCNYPTSMTSERGMMYIIPRYSAEFDGIIKGKDPFVTMRELEIIFGMGFTKEDVDALIVKKKETKAHVCEMLPDRKITMRSYDKVNTWTDVIDWALPLFT